MATNNYPNGSGGSGDWAGWIPIIILFCIPSPFTWIVAAVWLIKKLRGGAAKNFIKGNVKRHPYDEQRERQNMGWEQVNWDSAQQGQSQQRAQQSQYQQQSQAQGWQQSQGQRQSQSQNQQRAQSQRQAKTSEYHYAYKAPRQNTLHVTKTSHQGGGGTAGGDRKPQKTKRLHKAPGRGLIIGGACTAGTFAPGTIATMAEFFQSMSYGHFFSDELTGVIACAMFLAGGLGMLFTGLGMNRRVERYGNYLAYIGANREVDLARMAATFGVPVKKLCKDLRRMLAKGVLPTGYLDLAEGKLFLTEMGYRPSEPRKAEPEPAAEAAGDSDDAILREIRQVNDDIPDAAMSAKIDRIEEITRKILDYQKQHPDRERHLRTFLNYYLPTTLKILRAYAQLEAQGIEGENISAAKERIEGMMDQVVAGFEKQLDKLFQDDALDIASDVQVLENMLKKDGLSDGQGVTLGL